MRISCNPEELPQKVFGKNLKLLKVSPKDRNILNRFSLYSMCISIFIWLFLVSPEAVFDVNFSENIFGVVFFFLMIVLILIIHEIVHLLARPWQILRNDTYFIIHYKVPLLEMCLAIAPGGTITREGFIWMLLFPLLVLTILPFILMTMSIWPLHAAYGVFACMNIALSSRDMFNAYRVWKGMNYGEVLADEQS